jgi:hypothetical protein
MPYSGSYVAHMAKTMAACGVADVPENAYSLVDAIRSIRVHLKSHFKDNYVRWRLRVHFINLGEVYDIGASFDLGFYGDNVHVLEKCGLVEMYSGRFGFLDSMERRVLCFDEFLFLL